MSQHEFVAAINRALDLLNGAPASEKPEVAKIMRKNLEVGTQRNGEAKLDHESKRALRELRNAIARELGETE